MRTTVDLPKDLHDLASSIARDAHISLSQAIEGLIRQAIDQATSVTGRSATTGLVTITLGRQITSEDVRSLDDET